MKTTIVSSLWSGNRIKVEALMKNAVFLVCGIILKLIALPFSAYMPSNIVGKPEQVLAAVMVKH